MNEDGFFSIGGLLFLVTGLAFLVVVSFWVRLTIRSTGRRRRTLTAVGLTVIALAAVLFGGQWILKSYELVWRQWLKIVLALLLWCGGIAISVLLVRWNAAAFSQCGRVLRRWGQVLIGLCLVISLGLGTLFGGAWLYGGSESVVQRQGKTVVSVEEHFLDDCSAYYEYHGPFVRGTKPLGFGG